MQTMNRTKQVGDGRTTSHTTTQSMGDTNTQINLHIAAGAELKTNQTTEQETNNTLICIKQSERTETNNHTTTKRKNKGNRKNNITEMRIETRRQGKQ